MTKKNTPPKQGNAPPETPDGFCNSAANQLVWQRMHRIATVTGLTVKPSTQQATLTGGPEVYGTNRVFRHKFKTAKPDILLRKDVLGFDTGLKNAVAWRDHTNPAFSLVRTDDHDLLNRILDALEHYAKTRLP